MYVSTARNYNGDSMFHLEVTVTEVTNPDMRIHIKFDATSGFYLSLDDAKLLHQRLNLALLEAYDDIDVRDEVAHV